MVDYEVCGETYQAIADMIKDDLPDLPSPFLRITVDFDRELERISYSIESHHENHELYPVDDVFHIEESFEFSDKGFEEAEDFLAANLVDNFTDIPLKYNQDILNENYGGMNAFDTSKEFSNYSDRCGSSS